MSPNRQEYYSRGNGQAAAKLSAALERMRTGKAMRLPQEFKFTKKNWAHEAEVDVNTVVAKTADGVFIHDALTRQFERMQKGKVRPSRVQQLMGQLTAAREEIATLKQMIFDGSGK